MGSYPKSCSPISEDFTPYRSPVETKALDQVRNGLFENRQGRWKYGERSLGSIPTGGLVTVIPVPTNEASHTFSILVHIFSRYMKRTHSVSPMRRH